MATQLTLRNIQGRRVPHADSQAGFTRSDAYVTFSAVLTEAPKEEGKRRISRSQTQWLGDDSQKPTARTTTLHNAENPNWPDTLHIKLPITFADFSHARLRVKVCLAQDLQQDTLELFNQASSSARGI